MAESDSGQVRQSNGVATPITVATAMLSKSIDKYYVERLKVACFGTGISKDNLEAVGKEFDRLFDILKKSMSSPNEAVLFCCQVLQRLGYNAVEEFKRTADLQQLIGYDYKTKYPKTDCILTVVEFFGNLVASDMSSVTTLICNSTKQSRDRANNSIDLVYILFSEIDGFHEENISFILNVAKLYNRKKMFDSYLKRRREAYLKRKHEEEMKQQLQAAKKKELSGDVSKDGPQPSKEKHPIEEQTPLDQTLPTGQLATDVKMVSPLPVVNSGEGCYDHTTLSTERTVTDYSYTMEPNTVTGEDDSVNHQIILAVNDDSPNKSLQSIVDIPKLMDIFKSDHQCKCVESKWYDLGMELDLEEEFLEGLKARKRSDCFKLEEMLCSWTESDRSWDTIIQALNVLELDMVASKVKERC